MKNIYTSEDFMLDLNWDKNDLEIAQSHLKEWDNQQDDFYRKYAKIYTDMDKTEIEHFRNCINFWQDRLNNENQSS